MPGLWGWWLVFKTTQAEFRSEEGHNRELLVEFASAKSRPLVLIEDPKELALEVSGELLLKLLNPENRTRVGGSEEK